MNMNSHIYIHIYIYIYFFFHIVVTSKKKKLWTIKLLDINNFGNKIKPNKNFFIKLKSQNKNNR